MKTLFFCITACVLFVSCSKKSSDLSKVDMFIETLKEDKTAPEKPDFNVDNISELMEYRNEQLTISNFPRNALSSFYMEDVAVGMYVLWTIESLRMEAINDPNFYLFASLNPRIARTSTGQLVDQDIIRSEVAEAYSAWWTSKLTLEEKLQINPLEGLDLIWN